MEPGMTSGSSNRSMAEPPEPSYFVESRFGEVEAEPPRWRLKKILDGLDASDPEHIDPWLTHESGWTLSVNKHGDVVWANQQELGAARHLLAVSSSEMLRLWCALAEGELEEVEAQPWQFGLPAARQPVARRKDHLQRRLLTAAAVVGLSWFGAALISLGGPLSLHPAPSAWDGWLLLADAWLAPLFIGLALTAIVRGLVGRGPRDRDRRVGRACYALAAALACAFVGFVIAGVFVLDLPFVLSVPMLGVLAPRLAVVAMGMLLVAGLCLVSPPLIVALLTAERAQRADFER
jgi:hypothetical protein